MEVVRTIYNDKVGINFFFFDWNCSLPANNAKPTTEIPGNFDKGELGRKIA